MFFICSNFPSSSEERFKLFAKYGYKKSLQGKSVAIVGFKNKLTVLATKFAPRSFVTKISAGTMKKEK